MTQRNDWSFQYETEAVGLAAVEQTGYHKERVLYWTKERAAAKKSIEAKGIEVREYEITGGQRAEVVIDPTLANRLSEAQQKIKEHKRQAEEYENWAAVIRSAKDHIGSTLDLDHEDVRYFGLHQNGAE